MAVTSLVFGIIAIVLSFFGVTVFAPFIGLVLGIVGIVLACMAKKKQPSGVATAGLVLCIIATVLCGIVGVSCAVCVGCAGCAGAASGLSEFM